MLTGAVSCEIRRLWQPLCFSVTLQFKDHMLLKHVTAHENLSIKSNLLSSTEWIVVKREKRKKSVITISSLVRANTVMKNKSAIQDLSNCDNGTHKDEPKHNVKFHNHSLRSGKFAHHLCNYRSHLGVPLMLCKISWVLHHCKIITQEHENHYHTCKLELYRKISVKFTKAKPV